MYGTDSPSLVQFIRANPIQDPSPDATIAQFYVARARERHSEGKLRGSRRVCRDCTSSYAARYRAPRVAVVNAAKASGCVDCGLVMPDHPEVFDFDHISDDKVKGVAEWLMSGTLEDMLAEIARCEVVCANCHRIRTARRPPARRGRDVGAYRPRATE